MVKRYFDTDHQERLWFMLYAALLVDSLSFSDAMEYADSAYEAAGGKIKWAEHDEQGNVVSIDGVSPDG